MANNTTSRPWFLDTAGATPVWPTRAYIKWVKWNSPAAIGDQMILKDKLGNIIVSAKAESVAGSQVFNIENWYNGLVLDTLTAGSLGVTVHIK